MFVGTIKLDHDHSPSTLAGGLRMLRNRGVAAVWVMPDGIAFSSRRFGELAKGDLFHMFSGGRIRFDATQRCARCWLDLRWRAFLAATAVILTIALYALIRTADIGFAAKVFAFIWFWLVLVNLLISIVRFRSVLRHAMSRAGRAADR
jgi:hypothetical protein